MRPGKQGQVREVEHLGVASIGDGGIARRDDRLDHAVGDDDDPAREELTGVDVEQPPGPDDGADLRGHAPV